MVAGATSGGGRAGCVTFQMSPEAIEEHTKFKETIQQMREAGNEFIRSMDISQIENFTGLKEFACSVLEENKFQVLNQGRLFCTGIPQEGGIHLLLDYAASRQDVMRNGFSTAQKTLLEQWLVGIRKRIKESTERRLDIRRQISTAGTEYYDRLDKVNTYLRDVSGLLMAANEDYVLNHSSDQETNDTIEILRTGFTTIQKTVLEGLRDHLEITW